MCIVAAAGVEVACGCESKYLTAEHCSVKAWVDHLDI